MPLSDAGGAGAAGPGPQGRWPTTSIRAFLAQALDHGVFHADLHEGNLFVAAPGRS